MYVFKPDDNILHLITDRLSRKQAISESRDKSSFSGKHDQLSNSGLVIKCTTELNVVTENWEIVQGINN